MFERFTEGARRAVFFARYEAPNLGQPHIGTDHLVLGILRDDKELIRQWLLNVDYESAHRDIAERVKAPKSKLSVSVDLPLTEDTKLALAYAMEEADRLNSRHIGTEHLLLALMRDKEFPSAKLLAHSEQLWSRCGNESRRSRSALKLASSADNIDPSLCRRLARLRFTAKNGTWRKCGTLLRG